MEAAGVVFGASVSGEAPSGTGWTGPGAGWQPQSWQTACREMGIISQVIAQESPLSFIPEAVCPLPPPHFFSLC